MMLALTHLLEEGRIGQPWLEENERRNENRHRELIGLLLSRWSKKPPKIPNVDLAWLRPMHLTQEEAEGLARDVAELNAKEKAKQEGREYRQAVLEKVITRGKKG